MMKLTRIDKKFLPVLGDQLTAAVKHFADEFGLEVTYRGCRYGDLSYEPKLEFKVKQTADGKSAAQAEFDRQAPMYGLTAKDYGREFTSGKSYKLVGFNPRRPKYCVKAARIPDGKVFLFPQSVLARLMK